MARPSRWAAALRVAWEEVVLAGRLYNDAAQGTRFKMRPGVIIHQVQRGGVAAPAIQFAG